MPPSYGRHFLWYELFFSIVVMVAAWFIVEKTVGQFGLDAFLGSSRQSLYGSTAEIAGALLGFVLAGIAIIMALPDTRILRKIRSTKAYSQVNTIFFSTLRYLAATTVLALIALFVDTADHSFVILFYFSTWGLLISSLRLARCFWVLGQLVTITQKDQGQEE